VAVGPLTNVAWLAEHHPEVARLWLSVTCMAGQLKDEPECNVRLDVAAARIVCEKLAPRLIAMEAIGPALSRAEADAALDAGDPASAFLRECYRRYREKADWAGPDPEMRPLTVFDPATLLSLVRPDAFEVQPVRLMVKKDGCFRLKAAGVPVRYAFSSDWNIIKPLLIRLLRGK
jgi:inosine-uridine nucleoside N-ribohydrolase